MGPALTGLREKQYIAGQVPNAPEALVRWILDPQAVAPGTAMPDLGLTEAEIADIEQVGHRHPVGLEPVGAVGVAGPGGGFEQPVEIDRGRAGLVDQAAKRQASYIVMGSHGHTALYDLVVGSTTPLVPAAGDASSATTRPVIAGFLWPAALVRTRRDRCGDEPSSQGTSPALQVVDDEPRDPRPSVRLLPLLPLLLLSTFCATRGGQGPVSQPGHGAIAIQIVPNPIVAAHVNGTTYDFPFEVVIRETGGHPVEITRVAADVYALGGIRVANESYDAARIRSLGYATTLPANGELRYRFAPRKSVPDERLFGGVSAVLRVEGRDLTGTSASATTEVTVRR